MLLVEDGKKLFLACILYSRGTCDILRMIALGSGKTAMMREKLRAMDTGTMSYSTISLNSYSDAPSVQSILELPLEKKSGAA
jgi:hypothetical protein